MTEDADRVAFVRLDHDPLKRLIVGILAEHVHFPDRSIQDMENHSPGVTRAVRGMSQYDASPAERRQYSSRVESRCGAVVLGWAYLCPALSVAGASLALPCSVSTPRSSNRAGGFPAPGFRTRLYYIYCFTRSPTNDCRYVPGSRYSPSFRYRCWSGNRAVP
jgi:hypothetical protein